MSRSSLATIILALALATAVTYHFSSYKGDVGVDIRDTARISHYSESLSVAGLKSFPALNPYEGATSSVAVRTWSAYNNDALRVVFKFADSIEITGKHGETIWDSNSIELMLCFRFDRFYQIIINRDTGQADMMYYHGGEWDYIKAKRGKLWREEWHGQEKINISLHSNMVDLTIPWSSIGLEEPKKLLIQIVHNSDGGSTRFVDSIGADSIACTLNRDLWNSLELHK